MNTDRARPAAVRRVLNVCLLTLVLLSSAGCVRAMALMGKVVLGDPKSVSKFEDRTGIKLQEEKPPIIIRCTSPLSVTDICESINGDVENSLIRQMKQRELNVVDQNLVVDAIDSRGGHYDRQAVVEEIEDAKYIFEIRIEEFQIYEPHTPSMYHGICRGTINGYEIEGGDKDKEHPGLRQAIQVFEQEFDVDYPNGHPIPKEQMSESIFRKKFVNELTKRLGNIFYDVTSKELF
jgi:hypothetical protein